MSDTRIVFAGTPDFALASLSALVEAGMVPRAVYTQPDRPAGRGRRLAASPVKRYALERGIDVFQPATLKAPAEIEQLQSLSPDVLVVAAYGLLLPPAVLAVPRIGCVNVHASLLPRWRGAAPIQAAILAGDAESGVCLMQMDAGLDTGPVYACESVPISPQMTAGALHDALAERGGRLLAHELPAIVDGSLTPVPQDASRATYAPKIRSGDARIDWRQPATWVLRTIRAYNPVPGPRFEFLGEQIKCWGAESGGMTDLPPGSVVAVSARGIEVACGEGTVRLTELQRPGRKRVGAEVFARQFALDGQRFG